MKTDILTGADYQYNIDRDLFFNRAVKKAFSLEFVGDHPEEELRRHIQEQTDGGDWVFYFNFPPSEGVRSQLENDLESVP